jgi:hypothetical protein
MSDENPAENPIESATSGRDAAQDARIAQRRDKGATWLEIQQEFNLTRQQARYAYQRGKREERRARRRLN